MTAPAVLPAEPEPHEGVVLHPGTSAFGAFKRWPLESYAALGATGRARGACLAVRRLAPHRRLGPVQLSPKVRKACGVPARDFRLRSASD